MRYFFEPLVALILIAAACPIFFVIAIFIKCDSKGPVFYRQTRIGKDGSLFEIFKFRSMREDAEKDSVPIWQREGDARVTKIGRKLRYHGLDELPQLFNIITGKMSFIGPRPERPYFAKRFSNGIPDYETRYKLKPGITGLSQVMGFKGDSSIEERVKYDLLYYKDPNLLVDITITIKTIKILMFGFFI